MNMWRLLSSIFLTDLILGNVINSKENKDRKNLIQIQTKVHKVQRQNHINSYRGRISQQENNNIITYDLDVLTEVKHVTDKDKRYKQLPLGTVGSVRELKLKRRKRGSRGGINKPVVLKKPTGVVKKNLRTLPFVSNKASRHNSKLTFLLLNTQSLRNKDHALSQYMRSEAIDIAIVTETWLTNSDRDMVWLESNELVKGGLSD